MKPKSKIHMCYCQIPEENLKALARRRFMDHVPTEELMSEAKDDFERMCVATIALLNVPVSDLPKLVPEDPQLLRHLLDCRDHVTYVLKSANIHLPHKS